LLTEAYASIAVDPHTRSFMALERLVASLGMYDGDFMSDANRRLWGAIGGYLRRAGVEAPEALDPSEPREIWTNPGLIFGQTCGYPYITALRGRVSLIATPIYDFDGCDGPRHCSFVVASDKSRNRSLASFAGARAAINARDSNTGMNLFRGLLAPIARGRRMFDEVLVTGSHAASLAAVGGGEADIAAIDCVSYGFLRRGRPELFDGVAVIARTQATPGLPFVINAELGRSLVTALRVALFAALSDPALTEERQALGLKGAAILTDADYASVEEIERAAAALGYSELA
jgi:ABC-type phosphate/phosphonate transport system substrate-binding protein